MTHALHDFAQGFAQGARETIDAIRALFRALVRPFKRA
jgi:hypothetical protein